MKDWATAGTDAAIAQASEALQAKGDELSEAETEEYGLKEDRVAIEDIFKTAKAEYNWARYLAEEESVAQGRDGFTAEQVTRLLRSCPVACSVTPECSPPSPSVAPPTAAARCTDDASYTENGWACAA